VLEKLLKLIMKSNEVSSRMSYCIALAEEATTVVETLINPLTPELNPSAQRWLTIFFYWGFSFLNRAFL
jgi:hypothetical protein